MIQFQYYPAKVTSNRPLGYVSLKYFIQSMITPKYHVEDIFERISAAEQAGDMKLKAKIKQTELYYFTPSVNVNGFRRYKNITRFTGLLPLDFDHVENSQELKHYIFETYKFIIAAWLSPSKKGVKAFVHIPICKNITEYKERFNAIEEIFEGFYGFDSTPKNAVLPLFQSIDKTLLFRENYETFTHKKPEPIPEPSSYIFNVDNPNENKAKVINLINKGFNNIHDNGHPQMRNLCICVGGYVGGGYINETDALDYIYHKIKSHGYLCKGVSGYYKTAKSAVKIGILKPF